MNNKMLERWKLKTKGIFHKIVYDEFWFYIDDLMKENKKLTNNWNELEEYIEKESSKYIPTDPYTDGTNATYEEILDKMKEISGGKK